MSDEDRLTRRAAAMLLATMFLFAATDRGQAQSATVRLVVDYGDGVIKTVTGLPWAKGSTVLDMMNAAYHYLDLTPLGRHEEGLPYPMDWVRLRDQYQPAPSQASCCDS